MRHTVTSQPRTPLFYELDVEDGGTTLIIRIPIELWESAIQTFLRAPIVPLMTKNIPLPKLIPPSSLPWGFGPIFMLEEMNTFSNWMTVRCELPCFFHDSYDDEGYSERWKWAWDNIAMIQDTCVLSLRASHREHAHGLRLKEHAPNIRGLQVLCGMHIKDCSEKIS
jgi:hypothetical protein